MKPPVKGMFFHAIVRRLQEGGRLPRRYLEWFYCALMAGDAGALLEKLSTLIQELEIKGEYRRGEDVAAQKCFLRQLVDRGMTLEEFITAYEDPDCESIETVPGR